MEHPFSPHHNSPSPAWSVGEVAQRLGLKAVVAGGKTEYHGANPTGNGATKDGFILFENGTAWDRKIDLKYNSVEVARMDGIEPDDFEPCRTWRKANPRQTNFNPSGPRPPRAPNANPAKTPGASGSNASATQNAPRRAFPWDLAQTFDYTDEVGKLLYQIGRIDLKDGGKDFRQRRPDENGGWIDKLGEVRRVVFGLPDVTNAETILYVEGEKTAIAVNQELKAAGLYGEFVATTHSGGAKGLREAHAKSLYGKNVVVLGDNDVPGRDMAERLCHMLEGNANSVKRVELPNLPEKGDAVDYFAARGSIEGILSAAAGTPEWTPSAPPKPPRTATASPRGAESAHETKAPEPNEPTQPRKKRFPLATLAEVLERPDPTYLIHGFLVDGGTSLFTAKHASFKSFVCLDMTMCVAFGRPWHGYAVKRGTVIYVAAEGAAGLKKRALAWFHHHQTPVPTNFFVLDMPLKIADPRVLREFIEQVAELSPAFIILDTLGRCAVGLNENDPSSMGIFIDAAGQLAATTGAHVMTVHHNNKGGEYRGASSLPAGVDTHLSAERSGDTVTLKTEKQKDDDELEPLVFEKIVVPLPNTGGLKTSLVFRRVATGQGTQFSISEAERKVLMALAETFGVSGSASSHWKQAAEECGIKGATFYRCQNRLLDMGAVKVVRGERGKPGAIYVGNGNWPNPPEGSENAPESGDAEAASAPVQMNLEDAETASQRESTVDTDETKPPPNTAEPTGEAAEPVETVSESDAIAEGDTSDEGEVF